MPRRSLEYWAGFFDGEGCVYIALSQRAGSSRPQASLKVAVSNTHLGIIEDLAADFPPPRGRAGSSYLGGPKDQAARRQQYKWEMSGHRAYEFLLAVMPWLVIKLEQAHLAVEFYEKPWRTQRSSPGGGWKIRTPEQVTVDTEYSRRIMRLKSA